MTPMTEASLLLAASLAYLFMLWRTESLGTSIATTSAIAMVAVTSLIKLFGLHLFSFYLIVIGMGILVWRQIPNRTKDRWAKS